MTATQAPTPGPLSADDVKLLVKGDLLRIDTGGALYEFVRRKSPPSALIVAKPALGGSERYYDRCRFSFVERPSLAPTAPVEASGSERDTALSILQAAVRSFDNGDTTNLNGVLDDILDALRPQPSGETRPTDEELRSAIKATEYKYFGDYEFSEEQHAAVDVLVRAAQALLSARPLALGEQQDVKWLVSVGSGPYGPKPFDNEAEAIAYFEEEMAVPSYMGPGHCRHGSVTKVTTITEKVR